MLRTDKVLVMRRAALAGVLAMMATAGAAQRSPPRVIEIELRDGKAHGAELATPRSGAAILRLTQGETVELRFTVDRAVELHLHGYGLIAQAVPEAAGTMLLSARAAGRFPIEMHDARGRHVALVYVEVHPR